MRPILAWIADHAPAMSWTALTTFGLLVGLAALTAPPDRVGREAPGARLLLNLPDPLTVFAVASATLAVLLFFVLLLPRGVRRRRKDDEEEIEFVHEPPRVSPWVLLALWGLVLLPFAFAGYALWRGQSWFGDALIPSGGRPLISLPPRPPVAPVSEPPATSSPIFTGAVAVLTLCAGFGSLGLMLWIFLGERVARWWAGPWPQGPVEPLTVAVEDSLDDLRLEPDARVAIIKCYRRFEEALARSRVPRAPWQTPLELMRDALSRLPLPRGPVRELTRLFEVSRFSDEPVGASDREAAWASLIEIRENLHRRESDAPAA